MGQGDQHLDICAQKHSIKTPLVALFGIGAFSSLHSALVSLVVMTLVPFQGILTILSSTMFLFKFVLVMAKCYLVLSMLISILD